MRKTYDELANTTTHAIGFGMALVASIFLMFKASCNAGQLIPSLLYCLTLIMTYASSMAYHGCPNKKIKKHFQKLDHSTIYMTIAGSWTPIFILSLPPDLGVPSTVFMWVVATFGTVYKIFLLGKFPKMAILSYLTLGWGGMIWAPHLLASYGNAGFSLLVGGGIFYTIGVYFYNKDHVPYYHTIWHLLVMAGSIMHFVMLWFYVFV